MGKEIDGDFYSNNELERAQSLEKASVAILAENSDAETTISKLEELYKTEFGDEWTKFMKQKNVINSNDTTARASISSDKVDFDANSNYFVRYYATETTLSNKCFVTYHLWVYKKPFTMKYADSGALLGMKEDFDGDGNWDIQIGLGGPYTYPAGKVFEDFHFTNSFHHISVNGGTKYGYWPHMDYIEIDAAVQHSSWGFAIIADSSN